MPRSYFDVYDGRQLIDEQGLELPDLATACAELVKSTGEYLRDHPTEVWKGETWFVRLLDDRGQEVRRLEMKALILR